MPRLSDEQLRARRLGIGSSDIASILGLSPFADAGPMSVFYDKTAALPSERETSDEQELGHALEGGMLDWFVWKTGKELVTLAPMTMTRAATITRGGMVYGAEPWMFCTYDAKVKGESAHVECKNVGIGETSKGWVLSDDAGYPDHVRVQCAWQCEVLHTERAYIMSCLLGRPRVFIYEHDRELGRMIVDVGRTFWASVEAGQAPPLDATNATRAYLKEKYPEVKDPVLLPSTPEIDAWAKKRHECDEVLKPTSKERDVADAHIKQAIGEREGMVGPLTDEGKHQWKATWRKNKKGQRVFRFTWLGEEDSDGNQE